MNLIIEKHSQEGKSGWIGWHIPISFKYLIDNLLIFVIKPCIRCFRQYITGASMLLQTQALLRIATLQDCLHLLPQLQGIFLFYYWRKIVLKLSFYHSDFICVKIYPHSFPLFPLSPSYPKNPSRFLVTLYSV